MEQTPSSDISRRLATAWEQWAEDSKTPPDAHRRTRQVASVAFQTLQERVPDDAIFALSTERGSEPAVLALDGDIVIRVTVGDASDETNPPWMNVDAFRLDPQACCVRPRFRYFGQPQGVGSMGCETRWQFDLGRRVISFVSQTRAYEAPDDLERFAQALAKAIGWRALPGVG